MPDDSQFPQLHQPVQPHIFTNAEISRLLAATAGLKPSNGLPLRRENFRLALVLLYTTGLRRGELLRLTVGDYDPKDHTLLIRESKFHKSRLLPLSHDGWRELDSYLKSRRCVCRLPVSEHFPLIWNRRGGGRSYTGKGIGSTIRHLFRTSGIRTAAGRLPRRNGASTRNVRLAARYLASRHPERLEHCQRILGVPFKRSGTRPIDYLEYDEIHAVLTGIDRSLPDGRRDYALLATMFNTGARVQEILDLRPCDLQLVKPFHARLVGKGRKERLCPLWSQTAQLLQALLAERSIDPKSGERLFRNHRGKPLTRFGVRYLLSKHCDGARKATPTLVGKRLHPHSMRHSTAVHLLKSGVDLATISHWLGHASVDTTNRYATVDLDMKREAISKAKPIDAPSEAAAIWRTDTSILAWLESL